MSREITVDGVLRERWDDLTRTYTSFSATGQKISSRPYTAEENAAADEKISEQQAAALNAPFLRQTMKDAIPTLLTSVENLKLVLDKANADLGPQDTKTVAREARRAIRQLIAAIRIATGEITSTDLGGEA